MIPTIGVMSRKTAETLAVRQNRQDVERGMTRTVVSTGSWPNSTSRAGTVKDPASSVAGAAASSSADVSGAASSGVVGAWWGMVAEDSRSSAVLPPLVAPPKDSTQEADRP
jgi:hypothetical protein